MGQKKYFLGLDVGTDSVGFCVTDENYDIVKKHKVVIDKENGNKCYGNHLWGARLFDEAETAAERRTNRENRRRYQRRKWRIVLLQDIFKNEMDKVDPCFFDRLNNSAIHLEDREEALRLSFLLFNSHDWTDKNFYQAYPTIYHLRLAMINQPEKRFDLRMVYLVLAHMVKYRGNFLYDGEFDSIGNDSKAILEKFQSIDEILNRIDPDTSSVFCCDSDKAEKILHVFKTKSKKGEIYDGEKDAFGTTFNDKDKCMKSILGLIAGSTKKISDLFPSDELDDATRKTAIEFQNQEFMHEKLPTLGESLGEDRVSLILKIKEIYDLRILSKLLNGKNYVSEAMVEIYENHQEQLKMLKALFKRYAPEQYHSFFRQYLGKDKKPLKNYVNYVGCNNVNGTSMRFAHSTSSEDLYKEIRKILPIEAAVKDSLTEKQPGDKENLTKLNDLMDSQTLLLRQNSRDNGVLPYQLNLIELRKILENQGQYYPFLKEMDKDFINPEKNSYKIESILKFKIPYYVGPLSENANHHWIVKKCEEKITPWNFHQVVDEDKTAEQFMENLKNSCTYLIGEPTLPKCSLLYSMFILLNEMNKWNINDAPISKEDKQYLIEKVYFETKKPTKKLILEALSQKYNQEVTLTSSGSAEGKGITEEDIHANLSPWIAMMNEKGFGRKLLSDEKTRDLAEEIIYNITTFEDHDLVIKRLQKMKLTDSQREYFSKLKFSGWARLSKKLLDGLKTEEMNNDTGEVIGYSIMDLLWNTNLNFMEIFEKDNHYSFKHQVEELNGSLNKTADEIIEEEYTSPMMKRALRQTIKIVEELKRILKINHFDAYFVESTRTEAEKKRTKSRKKQIEEYYKAAKILKDEIDFSALEGKLESLSEGDLMKKRYFLYFMQLGRSVYTGEEIDFENLSKDYDIDHIIPRSKVKDDSFINTVLVEREVNKRKSDIYPISYDVLLKAGRKWVEKLSRINPYFMPEAKKKRITRSIAKPLTVDELSGFVNRQLVSTSQSVKAICDVLKEVDPDAKVIFSKAGLVSEFRHHFDLKKVRDLNDFHHAHDAYLNIVVGNVFYKRFSTGNPAVIQYMQENRESFNMSVDYVFDHDQRMYKTDALLWKAKRENDNGIESKGTIDKIRKYLSYKDPMVTRMLKTNVGKSGFFNKISIHSAVDSDAVFPLKSKGPFSKEGFETKYGGYSDLTNPSASLVRSEDQKGKHIYSIEFIPTVVRKSLNDDPNKLIEELRKKKYGLKNPEFVPGMENLLINTIISFEESSSCGRTGKVRLGIAGKSNDTVICTNLKELVMDKKYADIVYKISKILGTNLPAGQKRDLTVFEKGGMKNELAYNKIILTRDEMTELFDYIVKDVYQRPEFSNLPTLGVTFAKFENYHDCFMALKTIDQARLLPLMIRLTNCKSVSGINLHEFGNEFPSSGGTIKINKKLKPNTQIIQTSTTGLYERVLFTVPED